MTDRDTPDRAEVPSGPPLPPPRVGGEYVEPPEADQLPAPPPGEAVRPEHGPAVIGSAQPLAIGLDDGPPVPGAGVPSGAGGRNRIGDRIFSFMATGASGIVIVIVALIAVFLVVKSVPSIADDKVNFLTSTEWDPGNLRFGIVNLLWVTVIISLIALIVAVPIA